jgi:hypothetical protein
MLENRRKFRAAVSLSGIFQSAQSAAGSQPLRMGCSTATEKNIATEICVCNDKDSCNTGVPLISLCSTCQREKV